MYAPEAAESPSTSGAPLGGDDGQLVIEFGAGPAGVGPMTGLDSGPFFEAPTVEDSPPSDSDPGQQAG